MKVKLILPIETLRGKLCSDVRQNGKILRHGKQHERSLLPGTGGGKDKRMNIN